VQQARPWHRRDLTNHDLVALVLAERTQLPALRIRLGGQHRT